MGQQFTDSSSQDGLSLWVCGTKKEERGGNRFRLFLHPRRTHRCEFYCGGNMIHVTSNGGNDYIDSEGKLLQGKYDASKAKLATNKVVLKFKKDQRNCYSCKDCITHHKDFKDVKDHARHHVKMETMKEKYAKASKSQANIRLEAEERNKLNLHYETCNKRFERGDQINKHCAMNHILGLSIEGEDHWFK